MSSETIRNTVMVIPSLEPDERLVAYVKDLLAAGFGAIIVIDDGSSEACAALYRELEETDGVTVLHHGVNKGKGVALKTGYRYILEHLPDVTGVITADSDGQHTVPDCVRLAGMLEEGKKALYLGSRDFSLENVPPKSRTGNRITTAVFKALYGQYLPDTQTGLRAFRKEEIPFMIEVDGERYEYEMKVLIACARAGIPMIPVTIETIYENDNAGTHFHPIRDSWRIYKVILGGFFRFMGSSLICVLVDQILFNVLNLGVFANGVAKRSGTILLSTVIARVASATLNFTLNRNFVFRQKGNAGKAFWKYVLLSVAIMLMSAGGTWALSRIGLSSTLAKIIVDTLLYFVSYRVQQQWVFKEE